VHRSMWKSLARRWQGAGGEEEDAVQGAEAGAVRSGETSVGADAREGGGGVGEGGADAKKRVHGIVILDPSLLPGIDRPPPSPLMPNSYTGGGDGWGSINKTVVKACGDVTDAMSVFFLKKN
jgi:hypothetical protein